MSIEFQKINGVTRSVYPQFGGGVILADECKCKLLDNPMRVVHSVYCPIDEHKQQALNESQPVDKPVQAVQNS